MSPLPISFSVFILFFVYSLSIIHSMIEIKPIKTHLYYTAPISFSFNFTTSRDRAIYAYYFYTMHVLDRQTLFLSMF